MFVHKTAAIGNTGVGKTTIFNYLLNKGGMNQPTVAANQGLLNLEYDGVRVTTQLWDTAGSDTYRSLVPVFLRNVSICLLVYDLTDMESFTDLPKWVDLADRSASAHVKYIIIGSKCDLEAERVVNAQDVEQYASTLGSKLICHLEVSGLTGRGLLDGLVPALVRSCPSTTATPDAVKLTENDNSQKSLNCC